jgi:ribonucleoside-diphosphate reductase alpha chain
MEVIKRSGVAEKVDFNKIVKRILDIINEGHFEIEIDAHEIAKKVIDNLVSGITTEKLDHIAAEVCAYLSTVHPEYNKLAGHIEISNLHKKTSPLFYETMKLLYEKENIINLEMLEYAEKNREFIQNLLDFSKDYQYDYFGFKTLEKSYLLRVNNEIVERPQHMLMRVAVGIWCGVDDKENIRNTYEFLSQKYFTHATPTLFNSGTRKPQLASCFLTEVEDSIEGIYKTLSDCAKISQSAGGIGVSVHKIRSTGSKVSGTNGISNGIIPMLRVFNETARYVDQGGGKRKGAIAIYLEPWHGDVMDFLDLRLNHGKEELRTRDLFIALWIPDLFMERVEADADWSLMDPKTCPGLNEAYGDEFKALYTRYEKEGKGTETLKARKVWEKIVNSQIETGVPFILYKDHANHKSNHKHLGTIQQSNLCAEIIEYTSPSQVAVCNLGSVALNTFAPIAPLGSQSSIKDYDFKALYDATRQLARNLNRVIDVTYYPIPETQNSNTLHRPMGIGVQGLADVFMRMRYSFDSSQAKELNKLIFETMYFAAISESVEMAKKEGVYSSYKGSPLSEGIFQFNMWGLKDEDLSGMWDWKALRQEVLKYGVRNSLFLALMPTASTAQILGNNECFEPITSNIMARRVLSGDFININEYMVKDLIALGVWNEEVKDSIIANRGSVQHLDIPSELKELYKTVWEMSQKVLVDQSLDRGVFICQSQSLNIFMEEPNFAKITSLHFYGWKNGIKTGSYYLRQRPKSAVQFTIPNK